MSIVPGRLTGCFIGLAVVALALQSGCGPKTDSSSGAGTGSNLGSAEKPSSTAAAGGDGNQSAASRAAEERRKAAEEAARRRAERRKQLLADAQGKLAAEQWDEAAASLDELHKFLAESTPSKEALTSADTKSSDAAATESPGADASSGASSGTEDAELTALQTQLDAGRKKAAEKFRAESLARAQQWIETGKLDDAQRAIGDVLTRAPTDEERQTAASLTEEIERRRKARRQLKSWMQLLASKNPSEVDTARTQLLQDPDTALGMVLEVLRETTDADRASSYVETLRQFDRAPTVLPALVELLQNEAARPIWGVLAREIPVFQASGAGDALLSMAAKSEDAERRLMALTALAQIPDPPHGALVALAARVAPHGAESAATLAVLSHVVRVHDLRDWDSLRGVPLPAASSADETIGRLRETIRELANPQNAAAADPTVLEAARRLGVVTGLYQPAPLAGIKVLRAESETPEGPAAAVLDGVWNSVDPKTMWRYPAAQRGSILLDLGEERTVAAVRIWNWNEPSGTQRGWKEVEIFVSVTPAELAPVATGIIPPAPGVADSPDYGAVLPIAPTRGRYLRLQAKSNWTLESHSGLAEIQVLGF